MTAIDPRLIDGPKPSARRAVDGSCAAAVERSSRSSRNLKRARRRLDPAGREEHQRGIALRPLRLTWRRRKRPRGCRRRRRPRCARTEAVKEFYLGIAAEGRRSFRDVKHYRGESAWLSHARLQMAGRAAYRDARARGNIRSKALRQLETRSPAEREKALMRIAEADIAKPGTTRVLRHWAEGAVDFRPSPRSPRRRARQLPCCVSRCWAKVQRSTSRWAGL